MGKSIRGRQRRPRNAVGQRIIPGRAHRKSQRRGIASARAPSARSELRHAARRNIALSTLGKLMVGSSTLADRIRDGRVTISTVRRVEQWRSDHWPDDLDWPEEISRPAPNRKECQRRRDDVPARPDLPAATCGALSGRR